ncbi:MAG TPA: DUF2782 domain-containing protein [Burkholderiales bacterium]|nr:DUF2782 domain-containing protein [Burkholderiales bacterium]
MRRCLLVLLTALALPAFGQQPLPKLEPIPEPPPASAPTALDEQALTERGVQIRPGETAEEYMVNGQRVIRVRQASGRVYYLIEQQAGYAGPAGTDPSDSRLRVPQWVVHQW